MSGIFSSLGVLERVSVVAVLIILLAAGIGSSIAPFDPEKPIPSERLESPSSGHWFGTDENGIDILSRVLAAPRTDVVIALLAALLSVAIGAPLGVLAGFFEGGKRRIASLMGEGLLRILDVVQAFPVFVMAMVLVAIRGPSRTNIIAAIAFVNIPVFIRLVRAEVLSLRERPYAEAARAIGCSDERIAFRHLLPNALAPVVVQVSVTVGFAILLTAGLSFVGAGIAPPTPELGSMISTGASYMVLGQWWPSLFPGLALGLIVFSFATVGVALGRFVDPAGHRLGRAEARGSGLIPSAVARGAELDPEGEHHEPSVGEIQADDDTAPMDGFGEATLAGGALRMSANGARGRPSAGHLGPSATATTSGTAAILECSNLTVAPAGSDERSHLLEDVSLSLASGEVLGIVGESGSGKSVLVRSLLQLLPDDLRVVRGDIVFRGTNVQKLSPRELRRLRGPEIAHILPDAKSQLNPVLPVGKLMSAVIRAHRRIDSSEARKQAVQALDIVGIPDPELRLSAYPHELSGGMAQRVCIALALVHNPRLIIADEPTFGLDVTVQRQVLDLMARLVRERQAAQLIVTRDLGIAAHYCQRIAVMCAGKFVEAGTPVQIFAAPRHPYTRALLRSVRAGSATAPPLPAS